MKQSMIDTLVEMGAKTWERNGKSRLYLNAAAEQIIGIEYTEYKSGQISTAKLEGEDIANAVAKRIVCCVNAAYIDLDTDEIVVPALNEKYGYTDKTVAAKIAAFIAEDEDDTETEEATETYDVTYCAGESRMNPGKSIDYMIVDVDGIELYAEADTDPDDENGTEDALKTEIIEQAAAHGIDAKTLIF